jgi:hypothetical protein
MIGDSNLVLIYCKNIRFLKSYVVLNKFLKLHIEFKVIKDLFWLMK